MIENTKQQHHTEPHILEKSSIGGKIKKQPFYGQRLLLVRFYHNESMSVFAKKIGISKQAISKIESGKLVPSQVTEAGICAVYQMPSDFFRKPKLTIFIEGNKIEFPF